MKRYFCIELVDNELDTILERRIAVVDNCGNTFDDNYETIDNELCGVADEMMNAANLPEDFDSDRYEWFFMELTEEEVEGGFLYA